MYPTARISFHFRCSIGITVVEDEDNDGMHCSFFVLSQRVHSVLEATSS